MTLPLQSLLTEVQETWERLQWEQPLMHGWPEPEQRQIALVGLRGAGKKTLFNSLWGWNAITTRLAEPEETDSPRRRDLGLFALVDLPEEVTDGAATTFALENADPIIYLIDGEMGLRPADFQWIARLRARKSTLLVALNKADRCGETLAMTLESLRQQLKLSVLPVSANQPDDVQRVFLPALLDTAPHVAVSLASQMSGLRHMAACRVIRQSVSASLMASVGPALLLDRTALTDVQLKLVGQIAEIYGSKQADPANWQSALIVAFGATQRYAVRLISRWWPQTGWAAAGLIGLVSTWIVGRLAMLYFESDELGLPFNLFKRHDHESQPQ